MMRPLALFGVVVVVVVAIGFVHRRRREKRAESERHLQGYAEA